MPLENEIVAGDLVLRDDLMFLVVQIGWDYQEGFALCVDLSTSVGCAVCAL